MQRPIKTPDFSDWPPEDNFKGKVLHNMIKTYLRMIIDAEWRSKVLKDSIYEEWIMRNFNMSGLIDYCVLSGHVDIDRVIKWAKCIRERYDWNSQ